MKWIIQGLAALAVLAGGLLFGERPAAAFTLTFGGGTGFSATIVVDQVGVAPNQLRINVTNTTTAGPTTGSLTRIILIDPVECPPTVPAAPGSACRLLTSFGWAFNAIPQSITAGTATVPSGDTFSGSVIGTGSGPLDWSSEWGLANNAMPNSIGTFDFLSTNTAHVTAFCTVGPGCPNRDGPSNLDGPQGGILSATYTSPGGLGFARDSLEFIVTFNASLTMANLMALENATWFVEFGSGSAVARVPAPEPSPAALFGTGLASLVVLFKGRRRKLPGA